MITKDEAEVILKVNTEDSRKKFDELEKKAASLRKKFEEAYRVGDTKTMAKITQELNKTNRELDSMRVNAANIRAALTDLDKATPKQLQQTIKHINSELGSGRVKRGTKEWEFYTSQLRAVRAELNRVNDEMQVTEGFLSRMNRKFNDWGTSIATGVAAFAGVTMAGKAAVQAYADMEAEEANVMKFTGMTSDEVRKLNDEFKRMDTRTSREELNRLAQEAGRLGKSSQEEVLGFVRASDQINVALDELGNGATLELSKLTNIFGDEKVLGTEKALLSVGSVINELSQNCTAGASYMVDYAQRMAGVGAQAGMTIPQIMSFAAVLDSQGQNVEASATAMSQLIMKMYQDPAKIAKAAGMDVKEFSDILKKDANEALIMLLKTLNSYGGIEKLASIFDDMGTDGARASAAIAALAGNVDMLVWEQSEANKAFREATSVTKEYEVQNNTVQAKLDKARKKFNELAIDLGEKLLPVMQYCISGTSMLMRVMNVLIDFVTKNAKTIGVLTVAIVSYWAALKAAIVWQKAYNAAIASGSVIMKAYLAIEQLLASGLYLLTGNTTKAANAWKLFNSVIKVNSIGLVMSAIATGITLLTSWISKTKEAVEAERKAAAERKKQMQDFKRNLTSIGSIAADHASKQTAKLKELYSMATNVYKSSKKREEAAKQLQQLFPNTFKNLSAEKIVTGEAADAYERLARNIKEVAKAEATRDKIKANYKTQLDLEMENDDLADTLAEKERQMDALEKRISGLRSAASGKRDSAAQLKAAKTAHAELLAEITAIDELMAQNKDKMRMVDKANDKLEKLADKFAKPIESPASGPEHAEYNGESEKDRKAREKAEREAKKRQREEEAEAKRILKQYLEEVKATRLQEEAVNLAAYTSGQKNYLEYTESKAMIEDDYIKKSLKVLEDHGKKDSETYAKLLKQREELTKQSAERQRKASIFDVEQEHDRKSDSIVSDFFDPSGPVFQNQKALDQALLEEDIRYLTAKRDLYAEGSDEWIKLDAEIGKRIAKDQLDKQKETAAAYLSFAEQYRRGEGSVREQMELQILEDLHDKGLISEEEYQKAVNRIKKKYRDEDLEKFYEATNEYDSMIINLYEAFTDLFANLGDHSDEFWSRLAKSGEAAFAVMGAMMSQYSAYANAERDLELAKIEKRYDTEIKAAGSNTKKVQQLEDQKEKEIAKVKTKYNDRAMKLEIAQAIAQTAANALGAYGAMVKIPVVGPALAAAAAAMATAAGMIQVATIRKQHQAEAAGYYAGGYTKRDPDDRKEVGVVHANEFVANHHAVAHPVLSPILNLIDHAQRTNTVGSITAEDVSNAIGATSGVSLRGGDAPGSPDRDKAVAEAISSLSVVSAENREAIRELSRLIEEGIPAYVPMDGEKGFHRQYVRYMKMLNNPKR